MNNIKYLEELLSFLSDEGVKSDEVIICGSGVLACYGIRQNNDLEFITNNRRFLSLYSKNTIWGQYEVQPNIEVFKNFFSFCGFSDKNVFNNMLYNNINGFNIASLELEYLYKLSLISFWKRNKDFEDLQLIKKYYPDIEVRAKKVFENYGSIITKIMSKTYFRMRMYLHHMRNDN